MSHFDMGKKDLKRADFCAITMVPLQVKHDVVEQKAALQNSSQVLKLLGEEGCILSQQVMFVL